MVALVRAAGFASAFALGGVPVAAWLKGADGKPQPCPNVQVLESHSSGWPGRCLGLRLADGVHTLVACRAICTSESACSVWQFTDHGECWLGMPGYSGTNCWGRAGEDGFEPVGAERVQHGAVQVVSDMRGTWVEGLLNVGVMYSSDPSEGSQRCRSQCYSDISCRYWQYGTQGCWREQGPDYVVPSPPALSRTSVEAKTMFAGQQIGHTCIGASTVGRPQHLQNALMAGVVIAAGLLAAAIVWFFCCRHGRGEKRTRSVSVTPRKELATGPPVYAKGFGPPPQARTAYAPLPSDTPATTTSTATLIPTTFTPAANYR